MRNMDSFPSDLVPLPTMPYDVRPVELPLNIEECRTALWRSKGNVTEAAKLLKTSALRLRKFIEKSPFLQEEQKESQEQLLDKSEAQILDALEDKDDKGRADAAAKFVLLNLGARRGYGQKASKVNVNIGAGAGKVQFVWGDGEAFEAAPEDDSKVIDHDG